MQVDYLLGCHFNSADETLYAVVGSNRGSFAVAAVGACPSQAFRPQPATAVLNRGHSEPVQPCKCMHGCFIVADALQNATVQQAAPLCMKVFASASCICPFKVGAILYCMCSWRSSISVRAALQLCINMIGIVVQVRSVVVHDNIILSGGEDGRVCLWGDGSALQQPGLQVEPVAAAGALRPPPMPAGRHSPY